MNCYDKIKKGEVKNFEEIKEWWLTLPFNYRKNNFFCNYCKQIKSKTLQDTEILHCCFACKVKLNKKKENLAFNKMKVAFNEMKEHIHNIDKYRKKKEQPICMLNPTSNIKVDERLLKYVK